MNKQELIERIEGLKNIFWNECEYVKIDFMIELVSELDEPEAGHADEAPRYVKNILARLRELPLHDREVWLKTIMGEFERDFSRAKWREGYEQGKLEGAMIPCDEPQKVVVSEEEAKFLETFDFNCESDVTTALYHVSRTGWGYYLRDNDGKDLKGLSEGLRELEDRKRLIKAILDGFEVEKEKRYRVKAKGVYHHSSVLKLDSITGRWFFGSEKYMCGSLEKHTRKELEDAGFGEVFNSPLFEVEEVDG